MLPIVDDGSSSTVNLNAPIIFYGNTETVLYVCSQCISAANFDYIVCVQVNTNGVISFRYPFTTCCGSRAFPRDSPLIAPFWHDVNTANGGEIYYRQTSDPELLTFFLGVFPDFQPTLLFIATWNRVAPSAFPNLVCLHNTVYVCYMTSSHV